LRQRKKVSQMEIWMHATKANIMKDRELVIQLKESLDAEKATTRSNLKENIALET